MHSFAEIPHKTKRRSPAITSFLFVPLIAVIIYYSIVLAFSPKFRRIIMAQVSTFSMRETDFWGPDLDSQLKNNPKNADIQYVISTNTEDKAGRVQMQRKLLRDNPSNVYYCASLIRSETGYKIKNARGDKKLFVTKIPTPDANELDEYIREVQIGRRLDPDNAYFPIMQAVGYFAERRDSDALKAVHDAALCHRYEDYAYYEATSHIRIGI